MQNLVSNLTQFNNYQFTFIMVNCIIFIIFSLIAISTEKTVAFLSAIFIIINIIGTLILTYFFINQQNNAVKNHEYTAIRKQMTLEIESKSDMIKNHKFKIDSEDDNHIYIKTSSLFGTNNYVIEKSEIDETK